MRAFVRGMDRLSLASAVVAAVLLALATAIITWMVAYRAMGNSTYWEIELAVYLMVAALFLGSPYCLATGGHIGVDLLAHYLPAKARRPVAFVVAIVGLLVCLYLAFAAGVLAFESFAKGERTESTWRPYKWPLYFMMAAGLALTGLQYIAELLRASAAHKPAR